MQVPAIQSRTVYNFTVEDPKSLPSFNIHLGMPVRRKWWYIVVIVKPTIDRTAIRGCSVGFGRQWPKTGI